MRYILGVKRGCRPRRLVFFLSSQQFWSFLLGRILSSLSTQLIDTPSSGPICTFHLLPLRFAILLSLMDTSYKQAASHYK